jgi:ferrous iron transport protein B
MFFVGFQVGAMTSLLSTLILIAVILFGISMTFFISRLLSKTILKGIPSSFTLELPPYRLPQIGKVIVHSIFDRTLFLLGRAVMVAAPAGLCIWIMANITIGDSSLLTYSTNFLDPFARLLGMDGVILMAFILGFPANEIVIPIIIMSYMATGSLIELTDLQELRALLVDNGWTWLTAVCTMLFSLMHWPCSTTLLTIHKETQSLKWTAVSFLVPTTAGILLCAIVAAGARLTGLVP